MQPSHSHNASTPSFRVVYYPVVQISSHQIRNGISRADASISSLQKEIAHIHYELSRRNDELKIAMESRHRLECMLRDDQYSSPDTPATFMEYEGTPVSDLSFTSGSGYGTEIGSGLAERESSQSSIDQDDHGDKEVIRVRITESHTPIKSKNGKWDLNPKVRTVHELWQEWKFGFDGGPAIEALEQQYGYSWRKGNEFVGRAISDRKKIIAHVASLLRKKEMKLADALDYLEELRDGNSFSTLCKMLRNQ